MFNVKNINCFCVFQTSYKQRFVYGYMAYLNYIIDNRIGYSTFNGVVFHVSIGWWFFVETSKGYIVQEQQNVIFFRFIYR